jgi:hypothetical protein
LLDFAFNAGDFMIQFNTLANIRRHNAGHF